MAAGGSSVITQLFGQFLSNIHSNPLFLLSFIVPISLLMVTSMAIRRSSRKTKIDGPPTLEQKREKFIIPKDFFNREVERAQLDDYNYFLKPISQEFLSLKEFHDRFKALEKKYMKYSNMSKSASKKRKKNGLEGRKATFNDILNLYNRLRSSKFNVVEFEQGEERIL